MELLEGEAEFTKEKVEDEMELRECNETNAIYWGQVGHGTS